MKTYAGKQEAAVAQTARIAEVEKIQGHPKSWDRYIASRQKQVKEQSNAKKR